MSSKTYLEDVFLTLLQSFCGQNYGGLTWSLVVGHLVASWLVDCDVSLIELIL